MKTLPLVLLLTSACFAKDKAFPLHVSIVKVDMAQGARAISGDSAGISGGGSYLYRVYTVHVEGDNRELVMTTPEKRIKGGKGLAVATLGWSAVATSRRNADLHVGDYIGHWNDDGSLEIQFPDQKGGLKHQPFFIRAEKVNE